MGRRLALGKATGRARSGGCKKPITPRLAVAGPRFQKRTDVAAVADTMTSPTACLILYLWMSTVVEWLTPHLRQMFQPRLPHRFSLPPLSRPRFQRRLPRPRFQRRLPRPRIPLHNRFARLTKVATTVTVPSPLTTPPPTTSGLMYIWEGTFRMTAVADTLPPIPPQPSKSQPMLPHRHLLA